MTSVAVDQPELEKVLLEDPLTGRTEIRLIPDFLPLVKDGRQEGLLPIGGMTDQEIAEALPNVKFVDVAPEEGVAEDVGEEGQDYDEMEDVESDIED